MNLYQKIFLSVLKKIQIGKIIIQDNNEVYSYGKSTNVDDTVTIKINNKICYKKIACRGTLGAAESYMDGDWDTENLQKLIEIIIQNENVFLGVDNFIAKTINTSRNALALLQPNKQNRAKANILAHYDLGNEFFQLFLDPTMMYSCSIYEPENLDLEEASKHKLNTICKQLKLNSNDHVLEIGTGWGGFAVFAAQNYGCKVTTTTISDKQYEFVKNKIEALGLQNQIELINKDYRNLTGEYDKLVSIEMIEAVGHRYFDVFFKKCNDLLKPDGLLFLQAIVINDQRYLDTKDSVDFIKKYIFPGGCLPSIQRMGESIMKKTNMQLMHLNDIGKHYVKTLNHWLDKFNMYKDEIKEQGFDDRFIRMWQYYFCYCAAGFNTSYISDVHVLWRKRK